MDPLVVYYSSPSGNTHRFMEALDIRSMRIPTSMKADPLIIDEPYVLICPTYADDDGSKAVPKQVIRFLNDLSNRENIQGVIGTGNRNFGELFAHASNVIARKCNVPLLYKLELSGTRIDVENVKQGLKKLWVALSKQNNTFTQQQMGN
jgi:protein involved in ribonucleotide reduction